MRVIDGGGRTIVPGLIDTHVHALGVAAAEASQPFENLRAAINTIVAVDGLYQLQACGTTVYVTGILRI